MTYYDVFNGDADGICALQQLRLAEPHQDAILITGVKRDINLLLRLTTVSSAEITVLDISLAKNKADLCTLLARDNRITYIDHHFADDIPDHPLLQAHIDPAPETCTSLLVDNLLQGRFRPWAICGAFGDNLHQAAHEAAAGCGLTPPEVTLLRELGELLNYNSYGADISDLHFPPDQLCTALRPYDNPLDFIRTSSIMATLRTGYEEDLHAALAVEDISTVPRNRVYHMPNRPWARRTSGVFSNMKARELPSAAHVVMMENSDKTYRISVRAPLNNRKNADVLCREFPTGGGRTAAAGINRLPAEMLEDFLHRFHTIYP